ncbi:uncharacterized protein LOC135161050 [Diachasmimorpha longicaudata]|uniref:uncharacterized protein LOC135161050 n=1 Tax=Diachasmimorpha longicaudata TaxID=58733 RepID=UPI0030B901EB
MEKKTTEAYEAILNYVFSELACDLRDKLGKIHCDFEKAEQNAFRKLLPRVKIVPCLFHFAQAVWRQSKKKGVFHGLRKNKNLSPEEEQLRQELKEIITFFTKLPHLPSEMITQDLIISIVKSASDEASARLKSFRDYFDIQWMKDPSIWSVHGQSHRTNNFAESRNRDLNGAIKSNPTPWQFIRSIAIFQTGVMNAFDDRVELPKWHKVKDPVENAIKWFNNGGLPQPMDFLSVLVHGDSFKRDYQFQQFVVAKDELTDSSDSDSMEAVGTHSPVLFTNDVRRGLINQPAVRMQSILKPRILQHVNCPLAISLYMTLFDFPITIENAL